ncbi:hypothetical protein HIM_06238 [Hirsutella minnesotensis 3608]|uniref:Uncharacterized protein n=1 Tax=Hirsutella minnesotensis 3608 TaxID=1043627 RepID=A0A0F7ZU86_9HYPO|nr:hypothetical protein HIM_06238 [Hirsutella minnesotensis 3608]
MKAITAIVLSLAAAVWAGAIEGRNGHCGGDNCARQVTGTRGGLLPLTSRKADCSAFMRTTIVPDATTTTVTVTTPHVQLSHARRDGVVLEYRAATEALTAVPAYASGCRQASNYSSACSCWGITAITTTAPQPTKTKTVTATTDVCEEL